MFIMHNALGLSLSTIRKKANKTTLYITVPGQTYLKLRACGSQVSNVLKMAFIVCGCVSKFHVACVEVWGMYLGGQTWGSAFSC